MSLFNFTKKEKEPITLPKSGDFKSQHEFSHEHILKQGHQIVKDLRRQKKEEFKKLAHDLTHLLSDYDAAYNEQPLENDTSHQSIEIFVSIEMMVCKLIDEFLIRRRTNEYYFSSTFINAIKYLFGEMKTENPVEFLDEEYYESLASYVFVQCEKEQLLNEDKEIEQAVNFMREQYDKHPNEDNENKLASLEETYKDIHYRLSDYYSMDKSISFFLVDLKRKLRKAKINLR